jgi:hypothetical protein
MLTVCILELGTVFFGDWILAFFEGSPEPAPGPFSSILHPSSIVWGSFGSGGMQSTGAMFSTDGSEGIRSTLSQS